MASPDRPGYDQSFDTFSFGVCLAVMLTGAHPFDPGGDLPIAEIKRRARAAQFSFDGLPEWGLVSAQAKDLIRRLIVKDPSQRLDSSEMLQHPWFSEALSPHRELTLKLPRVTIASTAVSSPGPNAAVLSVAGSPDPFGRASPRGAVGASTATDTGVLRSRSRSPVVVFAGPGRRPPLAPVAAGAKRRHRPGRDLVRPIHEHQRQQPQQRRLGEDKRAARAFASPPRLGKGPENGARLHRSNDASLSYATGSQIGSMFTARGTGSRDSAGVGLHQQPGRHTRDGRGESVVVSYISKPSGGRSGSGAPSDSIGAGTQSSGGAALVQSSAETRLAFDSQPNGMMTSAGGSYLSSPGPLLRSDARLTGLSQAQRDTVSTSSLNRSHGLTQLQA